MEHARPREDSGSSFVSINPHLRPWWDFYLETWGRDLFEWNLDRPGDNLLLPPPSTTTTINLHKFLCLHAGQHNSHESLPLRMQLEWNDVSPPPLPIVPDTPNQALRWMYCQQWEYLTDDVGNSWYPTSCYTQHCSPLIAITCLGFVSHELRDSEIFVISLAAFFKDCQMHQTRLISHSHWTAITIHFP